MASTSLSINGSFRSSDVEKLTGIKRTRLQQWLEQGYFIPSIQKASGTGTQNLYDINDLVRIVLFKKIIEVGFPRKVAAEFIDACSNLIGTELSGDNSFLCIDYVVFCREDGIVTASIVLVDGDVIEEKGKFFDRMFDCESVTDIYILNAGVPLRCFLGKFGNAGKRVCSK